MTDFDEHGRPEPPSAADELDTVRGFLEYQRATFAWKCAGLDAAGLSTTVAASTMTLGGMMKHLALVEDYWFTRWLDGGDWPDVWDAAALEIDDWDWTSAREDSPEQLRSRWEGAVTRSRDALAAALSRGGLDQLARRTATDGRSPSLRWILCHMVEEYARHNGHADLLREAVDGETGE